MSIPGILDLYAMVLPDQKIKQSRVTNLSLYEHCYNISGPQLNIKHKIYLARSPVRFCIFNLEKK
jgi:hypothetical protein